MSCGKVSEHTLRSIPIAEPVPWSSPEAVKLFGFQHDGEFVWTLAYLADNGEWVDHSVWKHQTGAKSFVTINPSNVHPSRWTNDEIDARISELDFREQEIEKRLRELAPARAKTDEPIQSEDYISEKERLKHQEWEDLMLERASVGRLSRLWGKELEAPARSK